MVDAKYTRILSCAPISAFCLAQQLTNTHHGNFAPGIIFDDDSLTTYHLPGQQQSSSEGNAFIGDVVNVVCSLACNETFSRVFASSCAIRSQLRTLENTS